MKIRSIILCGLLLLGVGAATTSCEDMFTAENKLVTTDLAPQDTVYQMMGIVKRMQKLADRTVLLGEIRADLIEVDPAVASTDIQQLNANNISEDNVYNSPSDYYAVINSCNIYLAYVDSLLKTHGEYYYEKEICAAKCFRAWCYLELAKIYGSVPFVTEPVLTADDADDIVNSGSKADMAEILNFCIQDLAKYPYMDENDELRPRYGTSTWNGIRYNNVFIPVRALLGELYLWRGTYTGNQSDFVNAIRMYHDYFCFPGEELAVRNNGATWLTRDHTISADMYSSNRFSFSVDNGILREQVGVIPCDTVEYYGNVSNLRTVFCSQYANNYYPWVSPSQRIKDISAGQDYCFYAYTNASTRDTLYFSKDPNDYERSIEVGDLRLSAVYTTRSNLAESKYNSSVNDMKAYISKWTDGNSIVSTDVKNAFVPYYRSTILYLHLAEALNRAGFPETAYVVLTHGLAYTTLNDRSLISQDEFDRLCEIKSYGFTIQEPKYTGDMLGKTTGTFVVWPSTVFDVPDKNVANTSGATAGLPAGSSASKLQIGIHSIGSGDSEYNARYYLDDEETLAGLLADIPTPAYETVPTLSRRSTHEDSLEYARIVAYNDSLLQIYTDEQNAVDEANAAYLSSAPIKSKRQARVAQLILDEEALEGMFEGYRFYDIMRYQMQSGNFNASAISLPSYIKEKYDDQVNTGATKWVDTMTGRPWYLSLPSR